jgi:hypothetical protein
MKGKSPPHHPSLDFLEPGMELTILMPRLIEALTLFGHYDA